MQKARSARDEWHQQKENIYIVKHFFFYIEKRKKQYCDREVVLIIILVKYEGSGGRIFFSGVSLLSFQYPFHFRVTAVGPWVLPQ